MDDFGEIYKKEAIIGLEFTYRILCVDVEDSINLLVVVDKKLN